MITLDSTSSSEDEAETETDAWAAENEPLLAEMYEAFMCMGTAWFGSGFYRTGGYYHFCQFAKSFYTQRHLF